MNGRVHLAEKRLLPSGEENRAQNNESFRSRVASFCEKKCSSDGGTAHPAKK